MKYFSALKNLLEQVKYIGIKFYELGELLNIFNLR